MGNKLKKLNPSPGARHPKGLWSTQFVGHVSSNRDLYAAGLVVLGMTFHLFATNEYFSGFGPDMVSMQYPFYQFASQWLGQGVVPLWNPYIFGGVPFAAGVHGVLYPGFLIGCLFPAALAIKLEIVTHLILAALGGVMWARNVTPNRTATFFAGVTWALSGFFVSHLFAGHRVLVITAAYLPWLAWAIERALTSGKRYSLLSSIIAGLMLLAGHYQIVFIGAMGLFLFQLLEVLVAPQEPGRARRAGTLLLLWAGTFAVGFLIASPQILSMIESLGLSQRGSGSIEFAGSYSSDPANLLSFLCPNLFGNKLDAPFVGSWSYWESLGYVGVTGALLFLVSFVVLPREKYLSTLIVATLFVLLSFGLTTPVFELFANLVPGATLFRAPGRYVLVACLVLTRLFAQSLDALHTSSLFPKRRLIPVLLIGLTMALFGAFIYLYYPTSPDGGFLFETHKKLDSTGHLARLSPDQFAALAKLVSTDALRLLTIPLLATALLLFVRKQPYKTVTLAFVAVLQVVDLVGFGHGFLATAPKEQFEFSPALKRFLQQNTSPGDRIITPPVSRMVNWGGTIDVGNPAGYDIFLLDSYARYLNIAGGRAPETFVSYERIQKGGPLIRHLGAKYLLSHYPLKNGSGGGFIGYDWFVGPTRIGDVLVYRDPEPTPRAFVTHQLETKAEALATMQAMNNPLFDPQNVAYLDEASMEAYGQLTVHKGAEKDSVKIVSYEPNFVELEVQAGGDGALVITDSYHPGWSATIDGAQVPVTPANAVMRAIPVTAGHHTVKMRFLPTTYLFGLLLSALTIFSMVVWRVWDRSIAKKG